MRTLTKPKHLTKLLSATTLVLGVALTAQPAMAGIATSKHNLGGTYTTGLNNYVSDLNQSKGEICVFCHTPHGSNTSAGAPLWNKALPSSTYTVFKATASTEGVIATKPGDVSIACLSCHDGAQAMDNIINAPGSGLMDSTGGGATGRTWTWFGADKMASSSAAMLGTDLSNDHPVGIQYCGGQTTVGNTATCKDKDFKDFSGATTGPWWVDTGDSGGTGGARDKADMILYGATGTGAGAGPNVECASCHDPHSSNPLFLRRTGGNTGSQVCLSCHVK